jgi:hypothetical protein
MDDGCEIGPACLAFSQSKSIGISFADTYALISTTITWLDV